MFFWRFCFFLCFFIRMILMFLRIMIGRRTILILVLLNCMCRLLVMWRKVSRWLIFVSFIICYCLITSEVIFVRFLVGLLFLFMLRLLLRMSVFLIILFMFILIFMSYFFVLLNIVILDLFLFCTCIVNLRLSRIYIIFFMLARILFLVWGNVFCNKFGIC